MASKQSQLTFYLLTVLLFVIALSRIAGSISAWARGGSAEMFLEPAAVTIAEQNEAQAREAFLSVIPVLKHPRCLNCHSVGDYPRQGDDGHIHAQNVKRGPDGRGRYGEKCNVCHQEQNVEGLNMPPGAPNWHLPPAKMPMIWEGKTPAQICQQLKDPRQNGDKSIAQIIQHVTSDKLVMWGWSPGEGRTTPPMGHDEFAQKMAEWARYGAVCPK
jgi:hypothetical protein